MRSYLAKKQKNFLLLEASDHIGGHGCHFPPDVWKELGPALGKERMPHLGKMTFASSDIAKDWSGYLEGALYARKQAALESCSSD